MKNKTKKTKIKRKQRQKEKNVLEKAKKKEIGSLFSPFSSYTL